MDLETYKTYYIDDVNHWYISKIKQYDKENINDMAKGLRIIANLLSQNPNIDILKKFKLFRSKPKEKRKDLFKQKDNQIPNDDTSQLFLSLELLSNNLIDMSHLEQTNTEKYKIFKQMLDEFNKGYSETSFIKHLGQIIYAEN